MSLKVVNEMLVIYLVVIICTYFAIIIPEVNPRRFFQVENDIHNITLETSDRPGHQLVTHVFSIFLHEVLGYESVYISTYPDYFNASATLNRLAEHYDEDKFYPM